jgi:hypothetical protein
MTADPNSGRSPFELLDAKKNFARDFLVNSSRSPRMTASQEITAPETVRTRTGVGE